MSAATLRHGPGRMRAEPLPSLRATERRGSIVPVSAPAQPAEKGSTPPSQRSSGWRVDPAPDGRGSPPDSKPPLFPRSRRFFAFLLGLLVLNLVLSFATGGPRVRTQVPYQPFFVDQLEAGNVREISSRADTIEGELEKEASYD